MIKRILDSKQPVIIYNPPKVFSMDYFRECYRSGALPVFDSEFFSNSEIISILEKVSTEEFLFGIRLKVDNRELVDYLKNTDILNLDVVIFHYNNSEELNTFEFDNPNYKLVLEVIDIDINDTLEKLLPHALILKGNEAPGKVSKFTSMILLQYYREKTEFPVIIHGGVGFHTAPGIFAAGASGIVLDNQLYLTDEAPLSDNFKEVISSLKESDTQLIGDSLNQKYRYRFFAKLGTKVVKDLKEEESRLKGNSAQADKLYTKICDKIESMDNSSANTLQSLFYLGQDSVFSKHFVRETKKLQLVIRNLFLSIGEALESIDEYDPLVADSEMAKEHNTKYPIVQGPMANINDNPEFAKKVFEAGGLPFFAMGNLPEDLADNILKNGSELFGNFGAGLIGTPDINRSFEGHLKSVKKYGVKFALIAVGIPSYVNKLESEGTKTYLHTPALQMLENAMNNNCNRFIFEGKEAGGHIGTLTSFVLWEIGIEKLINEPDEVLSNKSVLFAGGIASKTGSHFISGMSSPLAKRGVKVGIQAGTPYLLTEEILETGALKKLYQDLLIERNITTVIGKTVGLSTRTVVSPFSEKMLEKEYQMIMEKVPLGERKEYFEGRNVGSLLIAAKAYIPDFKKLKEAGKLEYINYNDEDHYEKGNFHTGESIAFFNSQIKIEDIHNAYFEEKKNLSSNLNMLEIYSGEKNEIADEIAVVGMACTFPDADSPEKFWENIVSKKYSIREVPVERFDNSLYYSEDRNEEDKSYSKIAGVIDYFDFDYKKYGYKKTEAKHLSRSQQMILDTAMKAVDNAGYLKVKKLPKDKTSVIIGTCLGNEFGDDMYLLIYHPEIRYHLEKNEEYNKLSNSDKELLLEELKKGMAKGFNPKLPDGAALNAEASRIAKHLEIEGINYTIDAACATSLAALDNAKRELLSGESDAVIVGGIHTNLGPETFVGFAKMGALSGKGSFPFDDRAGGFVIGEGAGVLVLKRMKDAIRDGDTIHAVIKGIGSSSDGKGKAIAAPKPEGQGFAVTRAFEDTKSGITTGDVGFIEAHGTATLMGDSTEVKNLINTYKTNSPIGISSIKSQIGHLLGGAGAAGMIKAILALKNKTLPPNGQFETPSTKFNLENTPFFVVTDATEWKVDEGKTRIAGVSSFGFGGINYHVLMEEYTENYRPVKREIFRNPEYDFNDDRIVIAGLGVVLPGADNIDDFWKNLESGKNVITEIPDSRFHNEYYAREKDPILHIPKIKSGVVNDYKFNNLKYKIPPSIQNSIDRVQCFAIDSATQAIEQAGIKDTFTNGNNTGIIIGTSSGEKHIENIFRTRIPFVKKLINSLKGIDSAQLKKISDGLEISLKERYDRNSEDTIPGLLSNIVSGRIANFYNANGANYTIEAECASSAVGIHLAMKTLRSKKADYMIAGGADTNLAPANLMAYQMIKVLSPGENKIFDNTSSGVIMSEGAAVMVLTTYKKAREANMDIISELSDFSWRSYAHENFLAPTTAGFTKTLDRFYKKSPFSRKQVDYIDVFASSHPAVDAWERDAIEKSFVKDIYFGNIKPETGYFRSANPAVVLTKLALMAKNRKILPNFSFSEKNTIIPKDSKIRAASLSTDLSGRDSINLAANFSGLGGNHAHTIIRTLPSRFIKSAARTLTAAAKAAAPEALPDSAAAGKEKVAALLSGQGAQHAGMMKELYDKYPVIREIMDRGEKIFREARGYSLLEMMFGENKAINSTENTQPAIFLSSAALYDSLKKKGFQPDYMIGHSVGEFTALYCSGVLGFEDAFRLILKRSEMMKEASETVPGSIMVAFASPGDIEKLIKKSGLNNVYLANKNSENQTAVSGGVEEIDKFCSFLKGEKVQFRKLDLSGAFHTPLFQKAADGLKDYIRDLTFNTTDYSRVISNVTAKSYPDDPRAIKELLVKQLISPVEFIQSVENLSKLGVKHFMEIGPNRILTNLLKNIRIKNYGSMPSVDPKKGQLDSFEAFTGYLEENSLITPEKPQVAEPVPVAAVQTGAFRGEMALPASGDAGFDSFLRDNKDHVNSILYKEYQYNRALRMMESLDRFNFYTGRIVISGVSIGLPGKGRHVFEENNFDRVLAGENCIDPISQKDKENMIKKNITRIFKQPDGSARFQDITSTEDVIHLAGQLGYFDLKEDYGIDYDYDITYGLAIAAGIEALKDAGIPLVMNYQKTTTGSLIKKGYSLPKEMQEGTGVIFSSVFSSFETLINEIYGYNKDQFYKNVYKDFESLYYFLMETVPDARVKEKVTDWFFNLKEEVKGHEEYKYDRNLLMNLIQMGAPFFAQYIKAKGPNTQLNAACATTTQAAGVAEDWIRMGRCERVIIIGGEAPTTEVQNEWITAGFLAVGAATVKKTVKEAAKPFDKSRNGMIVGSGAVAMIVEREDSVRERGFNGQAELLGTYIKNSAFHPTRLDVDHITHEMKYFMESMKRAHGLEDNYADSLLFMSHETYTPARGGSADAEISALQNTFPDNYKNILITNTKGYTGHLLGVAVEDAILVKALQKGIAPPIANLTDIPDNFKGLKFSRGEKNSYRYGVHFSAGFGSQFALMFIRRIEEKNKENNPVYTAWLQRITGMTNPQLKIINRTLCIDSDPAAPAVKPREIPATAVKETAAPGPSAPPAAGIDSAAILKKVQDIIASQTGYTMDMLEEGLDLEADLGIDTVKQVEIFGLISSEYDLEVPEDLKLSELNTISKIVGYVGGKVTLAAPAAQTAAGADTSGILNKVQDIIASQTGYTVDMLEEGLDLEADLGIDTVKQVEIFGLISSEYDLEVPEDLKLSELNTISKIVGYVGGKVTLAAPAAQTAAAAETSGILNKVQEIISSQTGYSVDMLEEGLDLEADLGIDTVKQVEIFGLISSEYDLEVPEDLKLSELNTISKIVGYVGGKVTLAAPAAQTATAGSDTSGILSKVQEIISSQTGYSVDMLEEGLDLEADLGIDTVKQVEIFGLISSEYNLEVPEDLKLSELNTISKIVGYVGGKVTLAAPAAQPAAAGSDTSGILNKVQEIISSQTGYSVDMLEEGLDLEADLGIDTVKQVEIFGLISSEYDLEVPEDLKLSELNTISKIVGYVGGKVTLAAPVAQQAAGADTSGILSKVQEIISSQTGYSVDMLEEGLDLEADLGIDTVKQVEIFGLISSEYDLEVPEDLKLSELNTITKIVGYIGRKVTVAAPAASTGKPGSEQTVSPAAGQQSGPGTISRFAVEAVKTKMISEEKNIFENKTILVSPDKQGFSKKLIAEIEKRKGKAVTIGKGKDHEIKCDFSKLDDVENAVRTVIEKHPEISGFIHLLPLDNYFGKRALNENEINTSVKSLFIMVKGLAEKLNGPGSIISSLSFDSVVFPYTGMDADIHPLFAGIGGMMKTINKEFKDTFVKMVDFSYNDPKKNSGKIIDLYMRELLSGDTRVETGFHKKEKYVISLKKKSPEKGESLVRTGDTLLVTGGARGITFEILKEVVKKNENLSLILLGRSDIEAIDSEYLAESADEQFIFKSLKEKMKGSKPLEIRKATEKALNIKQTRANLEFLRSRGVETIYHSVDVSNRKALADVLKGHEKIDGIIHAAGVEISNFIPNKELRTFNLVFDTKITGMMNLLEVLKERDYRFLIGFSSVAAKFGNEGQIDYSGGNDMLCKMIIRESISNGKNVKIFDWTAWKDIGMATNETVKKVLIENGVELLPVDAGVNFFMEELNDSSAREVLVANTMHEFDPDGIFPGGSEKGESSKFPFLGEKLEERDNSVVYSRVLDIKNDRFLLHHVIDEVPLFLGSTGVETMAEAAATLAGESRKVFEVTEFEIPYGIKILKGRPREILVEAEKAPGDKEMFRCTITSQFRNTKGEVMGDPTFHYRGTYRFTEKENEEIKIEIPKLPSLEYQGEADDIMYHPQRLFMDDLFKTIDDMVAFDGKTLLTKFHNRSSNKYFNHISDPELQTDAILVDGMFQTGGLLEFLSTDEVVLPYRIGSLKFHRDVNTNDEYLCITEKSSSDEKTNRYQLKLIDSQGNLFISVEDFEMIRVGKLPGEFQIRDRIRILEDAKVN